MHPPLSNIIKRSRAFNQTTIQMSREQKIQRKLSCLMHACVCRNPQCVLPNCGPWLKYIEHAVNCRQRDTVGCNSCTKLMELVSHHSRDCNRNVCVVVPVIVSDLKKSDDSDQMKQASLDQLSTESHITSDPEKDDSQLKDHIKADKLSAGSPNELSFVASHVTVNFKDRVDITTPHSRPVAKTEQGKFQFTVTKISELGSEFIRSPVHTIGNLPWKMSVKSECSKRTNNKKFLSVYIYCNSESSSIIWSCESEVKFNALTGGSEQDAFGRNCSLKFNYYEPSWGFHSFLEWSKLMDPENEYVNNDEVTIEVDITIKKIIGFSEFSEFDFVSDTPPGSISDVVLIVDRERVSVCKYYLSMYSPVFHAMFFSEFIERGKKEIVLEDIEPNEFRELLHVIYPTHKPVTQYNVDFLLKLGDRFEIQFVIGECERFLLSTTEVSTAKKLIYADQYCLSKLQDKYLLTIQKCEDLKALKLQEEYKKFTSETKAALLERMLKIV